LGRSNLLQPILLGDIVRFQNSVQIIIAIFFSTFVKNFSLNLSAKAPDKVLCRCRLFWPFGVLIFEFKFAADVQAWVHDARSKQQPVVFSCNLCP
jgi:hypothetical protein